MIKKIAAYDSPIAPTLLKSAERGGVRLAFFFPTLFSYSFRNQ